jgi:hypothetical protein
MFLVILLSLLSSQKVDVRAAGTREPPKAASTQ